MATGAWVCETERTSRALLPSYCTTFGCYLPLRSDSRHLPRGRAVVWASAPVSWVVPHTLRRNYLLKVPDED